jgi:hypothetical protein
MFESANFDPAVSIAALDAPTQRFVLSMHETGGAVIDLGEAGRRLCDKAVRETERLFTDPPCRRIQDAWRVSEATRELAVLPLIHQRLSAAYGRPSFAFQTLSFREGSQQELHADYIHFSSLPERFMCGVWIALEDVEPGCGPLIYYPGSHRMPGLTMRDVGVNTDLPARGDYERHFVPRYAEALNASGLPARELVIPKGHAFVWAANLAHGGAAIERAGATRRSLVVHCYFDEGLYFTPLASDVEGGRLKLRIPPDIQAGRWRWPRNPDGRRSRVPMKTVAAASWRALANRPLLIR